MKRLIKAVRHLLYIVSHVNWYSFLRYYNSKAEIVILSNYLNSHIVSVETLSWEFGYVKALLDKRVNFSISSLKKPIINKTVLWSPVRSTIPYKFINYPNTLVHIASQLESQGCSVFPNSKEVSFLENKIMMHDRFIKHGIPHPVTMIRTLNELKNEELKYPLIWKGEHSTGSEQIKLVNSFSDIEEIVNNDKSLQSDSKIILQEFIDIRQDLRVTIVGEKVVLAFWRKNPKSSWAPTASKYGSYVDFENIPAEIFGELIEYTRKLQLDIGAYDIVFPDSSSNSKYLILEVSPRFSPNPPYRIDDKSYSYSQFKTKVIVRKSFAHLQSAAIFSYANTYVDYILRAHKSVS
jgi:glutathione synthase/RimK-type ligase-like ATP-grasp enzyme